MAALPGRSNVRRIRLRIDIAGTVGEEVWTALKPFPDAGSAIFGPQQGSAGPCRHASNEPHLKGEWWGAMVTVNNNFLAEYALPHYLEQPRVLDAVIEPAEEAS